MKYLIQYSTAAALSLATLACFAQGTLTITFDGPPPLGAGQEGSYNYYEEFGVGLWPTTETGFDWSATRVGNTSGYPSDGSPYIAGIGYGTDSVDAMRLDWGPFGVTSVDLAGYSTYYPDFNVTFYGFRQDGSAITQTVSGSGIDFDPIEFGPEWASSLKWFEIHGDNGGGWSADNLVVIVPEPSVGVLFVLGALTFSFWQKKRRKA